MLKSAKGIGELIYYYRLVNNFSQQELAEKLHVTVSAISSWERGINKPGVDIASVLADAMKITLDDFFRMTHKPKLDNPLDINEVYAFEKAFLKIKDIAVNAENQNLVVTLLIWGVSVEKDTITKSFTTDFYCNKRMCNIAHKEVKPLANTSSTLSPEFKSLPSLSRRFEIVQEIDYEMGHDLEIKASLMDEEILYNIPGILIQTIIKGPLFNIQNPKATLEFLKSSYFKTALEYYSNINDYDALQEYLVNQYESLLKYLIQPNSSQKAWFFSI